MKLLTVDEVEIRLTATPDPEDIDAAFDPEIAKHVWEAVEQDPTNEWLWCIVEVEVRWRGLRSWASLGGCSYASRTDFMLCGYYPDLVEEALAHMNEQVEKFQRPDCDCEAKKAS